jgi:hypothetical protein
MLYVHQPSNSNTPQPAQSRYPFANSTLKVTRSRPMPLARACACQSLEFLTSTAQHSAAPTTHLSGSLEKDDQGNKRRQIWQKNVHMLLQKQ